MLMDENITWVYDCPPRRQHNTLFTRADDRANGDAHTHDRGRLRKRECLDNAELFDRHAATTHVLETVDVPVGVKIHTEGAGYCYHDGWRRKIPTWGRDYVQESEEIELNSSASDEVMRLQIHRCIRPSSSTTLFLPEHLPTLTRASSYQE